MKLLITFSFTLISTFIFSQLKGRVSDENNTAIEGVDIMILNSDKGTYTDAKGNYSLDVEDGNYTITASYIGFKTITKKVKITNRIIKKINFRLIEDKYKLEDVIVKAKTKSEIIREKSFAVEVISMKGLKNLSSDANSILGKVSGVNIRQSGGAGSDFTLSLNGFSGDQVRVFIDGIPMHYFGSSLSLNNFPSNLIEQIEVYKGVVPIHLSSDALGGAINVVTNKSKKNHLDVAYSIGSYGAHRYSVAGQFRNKSGATLKLKSFYNRSINDYKIPTYKVDNSTGKASKTPVYMKRFHAGYNSQMIWPEIGFTGTKFADELLFGIMISKNFKEIQQPINAIGEPRYPYGEVNKSEKKTIGTFSYRKKRFLNDKISLNAYLVSILSNNLFNDISDYKYLWNGDKVYRDSYTGEIENRKTKLELEGINYLGNVNTEYRLNSNNNIALNYSFSHYKLQGHDEFKKQNNTQFGEPTNLNKQISGLNYANNSFDNKLKTSVFSKYYKYDINSLQTDYVGSEKKEITENIEYFGYGISTSYQLNILQLKASFENALRFPEILELFGNGSNIIANPILKPEKSNNLNLGFRFKTKNSINNIIASVNTFLRKTEGYIYPQTKGIWTEYKNTKNASTKGVDLSIGYNYKNNIVVSVNGSYYEKINSQKWKNDKKTDKNTLYNIRFPNEPYLFGNVSVSYKKNHLFINTDTFVTTYRQNYTHKFYYKWSNLGLKDKSFIPQQYTSDLEFAYSLDNQTYNFSIVVNNIFDLDTFDNFKQIKPGRVFGFKLRYFIN